VFHSFSKTEEVHVSEESVEASIGFSSLSHEASKGDGVLLASHLTGLVDLVTEKKMSALHSKDFGKKRAFYWQRSVKCLPRQSRSGRKRGP